MKILYILSGLGVIALLAEIFRFKKFLLPVILLGLLGAIGAAVKDWNTDIHYYSEMLTFNNYALLFTCVICGTAFLWFMMAGDFFKEESSRTDHFALILFALCGAVILTSYTNMVMLFLGIEILSIPLYVLAGSRKEDLSSNESALKYFLMGAFATGFLLFGIALLYGFFGTFNLNAIHTYVSFPEQFVPNAGQEVLLYGGILFMLIGLSFKVSAVPFHFWAPDVYQGAPSQVTAFMSSIVKTAAFAAFLRLFMMCFAGAENVWANIVWVMAALTILLGNITAVYQKQVKRMLAYSSISHAGYMLLALLAMNDNSSGAVLFYAAAYSVSTIGAFAVLTIVEKQSGEGEAVSFDSFAGLSKRNPILAFGMCISMLSLSGIPPLAGFFGKYYIFTAALNSGFTWLVLIAVVGSLIGVYYYLRVIISMYMKGPGEGGEPIRISFIQKLLLAATVLLALLLGIFPEAIIRLI